MEIGLTLLTVVFCAVLGGSLAQNCTTDDDCAYSCCGSYPDQQCCVIEVDNVGKEQYVGFGVIWFIILIVIGAMLLVSAVISIVCCMIRRRGVMGTAVNRQGLTVMTTGNTVFSVNGYQQPFTWQYPQNPPPYYQQTAPNLQLSMTSNFQQQVYPMDQPQGQTDGYTFQLSPQVNDTKQAANPPPAYEDTVHGEN